jgi:hypothetical protein
METLVNDHIVFPVIYVVTPRNPGLLASLYLAFNKLVNNVEGFLTMIWGSKNTLS